MGSVSEMRFGANWFWLVELRPLSLITPRVLIDGNLIKLSPQWNTYDANPCRLGRELVEKPLREVLQDELWAVHPFQPESSMAVTLRAPDLGDLGFIASGATVSRRPEFKPAPDMLKAINEQSSNCKKCAKPSKAHRTCLTRRGGRCRRIATHSTSTWLSSRAGYLPLHLCLAKG